MAQYFEMHPETPQQRLLRQAAAILNEGGVIAYPTDSSYALGCHLGDKRAVDRIRQIRRVSARHNFTLVCRDLAEIGTYARVDNVQYRLLKSLTPGPYTFILPATKEVPKRLQNPKRKTVGLRVPENRVAHGLLDAHGAPILSSTLLVPGRENPLNDPYDIRELLGHELDLIIDAGPCPREPTSVLDLTGAVPEIVRAGLGDVTAFEAG